MKANIATALLILLAVGTSRSHADLATIDFDSLTSTNTFVGGIEDGYIINNISGPVALNNDYLGAFSGTNSIHHDSAGLASFEITHSLGSLFELESFMAGSAFGGAEPLIVNGFVGGVLVGTDIYNPNPANSYFLFNPTLLLGVQVDRLVFNMGIASLGPTHIDDIILDGPSAVPEPSSTILGLAGLIAICSRRRR